MGIPLRVNANKATRQSSCHLTGVALEPPCVPSDGDGHVTRGTWPSRVSVAACSLRKDSYECLSLLISETDLFMKRQE